MEIVPQLIANSIIAGSIYALVGIGFNLIFGVTKFFNLSHGVVSGVGAYVVYALSKLLGWSTSVSVFFGLVGAALIGVLLDTFLFKKLRSRKASQMVFLVASLGAFTAIQAVIAMLFSSQFQTLGSSYSDPITYQVYGAIFTQVQVVIILSVIGISIILALLLKYSMFGKAVQAIGDSEHVAKIIGINTEKVTRIVFAIGSLIAGLAGILVGFDTGIEPTMGMGLLLKGVIASIIGGVGSVWGAVLGAFLLGFIENFGIWHISGEWKDAIAFGVLILFLLIRPRGILKA